MDINTYSKLAIRTANDLGHTMDLVHGALLITSEAGEVADAIKKHVAYGRELDVTHLAEELGDSCWAINLLITKLGLTWEQVLAGNIAKLEARYPDLKFSAEHATDRNKEAEIEAIAKVL